MKVNFFLMVIAEIKQHLTLAQVLQHYGLKFDKHLRLHCPFHEDKTPPFRCTTKHIRRFYFLNL